MFGKAVTDGVWQTAKSGPTKGGDMSRAVAPAPVRATMFPPSSVSRPALPSAAAPAETSSFCDRVNGFMSSSKIGRRKKSAESEIQRATPSRDPKNFEPISALLQDIHLCDAHVCFWPKADIGANQRLRPDRVPFAQSTARRRAFCLMKMTIRSSGHDNQILCPRMKMLVLHPQIDVAGKSLDVIE
jgi:hypothetical protein